MENTSTLRRFRKLSRRFVDRERRRHLLIELAIFSLLAAASAWPITHMLDAMSVYLR
jgi:hypothetical protein